MKLLTTQMMVSSVASHWMHQYFRHDRWSDPLYLRGRRSAEDIYRQLLALPADATAGDVAGIIGNSGWTQLKCAECQNLREAVVIVSDPYGDDKTVYLCETCLTEALKLLRKQ